jgi:hypothetical protein
MVVLLVMMMMMVVERACLQHHRDQATNKLKLHASLFGWWCPVQVDLSSKLDRGVEALAGANWVMQEELSNVRKASQ